MGKHHREPIKYTCPDIDKLIKGQNEIMKIIRNYQKIDEVEDLKDIISDIENILWDFEDKLEDLRKSNETQNGNFAKPMLGAVLSKSTTINVEILKLEKEVPPNEVQDFNDWLIHKGIEVGLGKHYEYYDYTDNVKDAIPVTFRVYCT